ncbi:cell wall protein DAN4 [Colossoma macropomum]|uniref:cell wall protein DAN4 n=1 Tax=Colossoma macropomum TaxID=42526 RepID=UPI001863CA9B|nr:cell wall protein DAN4 [Colossoma macropomum]
MSSNKTLQSGVRPSQAIKDTTKRRTGLLKDNSWIKRDREEDEPVDVDPNYGRGVLLKTQNNSQSKPAEATLINPVSPSASVNSLTKNTTTTPKSSVTVATSPTTATPNKPPVPAKNPTLTTTSKSFTARVFSGANSSEKALTPVKRSMDEKSPVSKEPPKDVTNGNNSAPLSPAPSAKAVTSPITKSEIKPSMPQSTTVTSTSNAASKSNTTITSTTKSTTPDPAASSGKALSNTMDIPADILIPALSPTVYTNPVSPKSSSDTLSYNSSQPVNTASPKILSDSLSYTSSQPANTTSTTLRTSVKQSPTTSQTLPSLSVNSPPLTQLSTRIVGKRDLCSFCGKNISGGERMILDDLQIFSHTSCFKCELCCRSLGNLEAGATLWVHREKVNCENCYKKTKDHWFH